MTKVLLPLVIAALFVGGCATGYELATTKEGEVFTLNSVGVQTLDHSFSFKSGGEFTANIEGETANGTGKIKVMRGMQNLLREDRMAVLS